MVEFKSEMRLSSRPVVPFLAVGVLLVAAAALYFYVRHQQGITVPVVVAPVVVPGVVRAGEPAFEYYKNKIKVEKVRASLSITFSKQRVATISGIIVNDGDRKLEALEMRLTLYDVYGKLSRDKTTYALRPGLGIGWRPMEPLEKRGFAINVESIEQLWNPKHVEYEVTGLKYQ